MSLVPSFFGPRTTVYGPFTTADELLESPFHHGYYPPTVVTETSTFATHVDWNETPHAYVLKIHLPGLKKEDVNVEVEEGRVLKISGERNEEFEDRNGRWHRVERRSGMFLKRVQLPENARVEQLKAKMVNGELTITVPKSEAKRTNRRFVEIYD